MALDGLVVRAIAHALQAYRGSRIHKIHQPDAHELVWHIRSHAGNGKWLLSANPTYPRVHVTERSFHNPMEAPMFCMLLRKHLEGGVIEDVRQVGAERILHIDVRQRDELGDVSLKRVIVELMGRHSNVIVTDDKGVILDGIHHVTPAISSHRIVMPGAPYTPPPEQNKASPFELDRSSFAALLNAGQPGDAADWEKRIVSRISGFSPLTAREVAHRAQIIGAAGSGSLDTDAVWNAFAEIRDALARHSYEPNIVATADGKAAFSVIRLTHLTGEARLFDDVGECLEAFYGDKAERDLVKSRAANLIRLLTNERSKNEKKLEKLQETLDEAKDADRFRMLGELLTANLHVMEKGMAEIEVVNYYDEEQQPIAIALDPQLAPSENAQRYFKRYAKLKNSIGVVRGQMEAARADIAYIDTVLAQLGNASLADLDEIREELAEQGFVKERAAARKKKKQDKPRLLVYTSSEGIPIYVGKNNIQNEYLTIRLADANDTWLHTKDIPGSHVVIKSREFGDGTLHEAAKLAALYSKARDSSQVPVDYTLVRHVKKPNGAKPGFVIYDRQHTLFVTPDEQLAKSLPSTVK